MDNIQVKMKLKANLDGEMIEIEVGENESILDALLNAGFDPPFSCQSAACATCMAKLVSGQVEMDECFALTDDEIKEGLILTCQSKLKTDEVEIDYNV